MSAADVAVLRGSYEAFNRGDIPAVLASYDSGIEWYEPGGGRAPRGTFRGSDSVAKDVFSTVPANFEQFEAAPERFIDAGEHIVVVGRFRGKAKNGRQLDAAFAHVATMRGGKVLTFHNYVEAAPWAEAWGG